jgi:hypothetical protein
MSNEKWKNIEKALSLAYRISRVTLLTVEPKTAIVNDSDRKNGGAKRRRVAQSIL